MSAWTDLGGGAFARASRVQAMNSVVVAGDGHAVVVDAGVLPGELDDLAAFAAARAPRRERVSLAFTHPHWDHVLARPWFPGATTIAGAGFAADLARDAAAIGTSARREIEAEGEAWTRPFLAFAPDREARDGEALRLGPWDVVVHAVPGHCPSQVAFRFPALGLFVAADLLSDREIPWLDEAPLTYRRTLETLRELFASWEVRVLVPGHGAPAHGPAEASHRLARDLDYLRELEQRVGEAYRRGLTLEETRVELARMHYLGRDAAWPMNGVHSENVRYTYQGLAAQSADAGRT